MDRFSLWLDERIVKLQDDKYDDSVVLRFLNLMKTMDSRTIADIIDLTNLIIQYSALFTLESVRTVYKRLSNK